MKEFRIKYRGEEYELIPKYLTDKNISGDYDFGLILSFEVKNIETGEILKRTKLKPKMRKHFVKYFNKRFLGRKK